MCCEILRHYASNNNLSRRKRNIAICRVNAGIKVCQSLHCTNLEYRLVGPAEPRSYGDVRLCPARPCTARLFALAISSSSMAISAPAAMEAAIFSFASILLRFLCSRVCTHPRYRLLASKPSARTKSNRACVLRVSKIFSNYSFNLKDGDQIRMSVPERRGVVVVFQGCGAACAANATILAGGVLSMDPRGDRTLLLHFFFKVSARVALFATAADNGGSDVLLP